MSLYPAAQLAARAIMSGPFAAPDITKTLADYCDRDDPNVRRALRRLSLKIVTTFGPGTRPRLHQVASFLHSSRPFHRLIPGLPVDLPPASMQPAAGPPASWILPDLPTLAELADWLNLTPGSLHHLSAPWRTDTSASSPNAHYRQRWIPRQGKLPRLIESPLPRLKTVQQTILHHLLRGIPTHPAAHGFVRGRSILTFTQPHANQRFVLRMDIADFFPTLRRAKIVRIFLTAGYPESVATALANLCTTSTPATACLQGLAHLPPETAWPLRQRLRQRHLPQGAPTSPALANLAAYRLDCRLTGLASQFAATYTRYADDLLFSGPDTFRRDATRCQEKIATILLDEGFTPAWRKTRHMPSSVSQRAAGLVLNHHPALPRQERDLLKAILTNCLRHGPDSQNHHAHPDFRAHLQGRIAQAAHTHPASSTRLTALFQQISWTPS